MHVGLTCITFTTSQDNWLKNIFKCYWKFGSREMHRRLSRKAVLSLIVTIREQNLLNMLCIVWPGAIHVHSLEISFARSGANWVQSTCISDRVGKLCFPLIAIISDQSLLMGWIVWLDAIHDHWLEISLARNGPIDVHQRQSWKAVLSYSSYDRRENLIFLWIITPGKQRSFNSFFRW